MASKSDPLGWHWQMATSCLVAWLGVVFSGRLRPSPAVSGRLQPSPAVSGLKDATSFPLKIVNWPFANCQWDSNQLASKSDPLGFHWQSFGNWQLAAWLPGWGLETGGWGLAPRGSGARTWMAGGLGLGWLVAVIGHWLFSWWTGWLSREAWFSVRGLDQVVNGSLFRDW